MDGVVQPKPCKTPVVTNGAPTMPGDPALFAAVLGALRAAAADANTATTPAPAESAGAEVSAPSVLDPAKETGEAARPDQPAVADHLLLQAVLVPRHPGAILPPVQPPGKGGTSAIPAPADACPPVPAGIAAPARPSRPGLAGPPATEGAPPAPAMGATETQRAASSTPRTVERGAGPAAPEPTDVVAIPQHPSALPEVPLHHRTDATAPPGAAPVPTQHDTLSVPPPDVSPPRIAPPAPIRQVAQIAIALSAGGEDEDRLSVALDPIELGRVEISIERQGGSAQVRVVAERPETLALLQRDHRELDRLLGQSGIGEEGRSLSFGLSPDGSGGNSAGGNGRGPRHHGGTPLLLQPGTEPATRPLLGLIDLAV